MKTTIKKQTGLLLITALFSLNIQAQWNKTIKGNGNIVTVSRTTQDYHAIKCIGAFDYILTKGTEGQLKLEGEDNILQYITTEVKGGRLTIKTQKNINIRTNKDIKISIPVENVEKIDLVGSGDLWNTSPLNEQNLEISLTGSGDINLDIKTTNTKALLSGSGDIELKGNTDNLDTKVTGSGDFNSINLNTKNTSVSVAGSGDAKVVSTENLKASVLGSGDIVYKGKPKKEDTKVSGSGSISSY
ncbi:MAG: head GIN domain-containing protein [Aestuariibaculum sp.]